jgi:phospholipid/cholesterol/gamma-HCH transport system substrate-binding protein
MENKANYTLVGAFVLIFILFINIFVLWISRGGLHSNFTPYDIYFSGSVTGLEIGSSVRYRGIPVGKVKNIEINPENLEQIHVTTHINKDVPIKEDAYASLESIGITGIAYIQINGGSQSAPILQDDGTNNAVILSRASRFEEVVDTVPALLRQSSALIQDIRSLLSEENRASLQKTLENISLLTASLVPSDKNAASIADTLRDTALQLKHSLKSLEHVAVNISNVLESNGGNLSRFLNKSYETLETLDRIGRALEESPTRFLANDSHQGVRVP